MTATIAKGIATITIPTNPNPAPSKSGDTLIVAYDRQKIQLGDKLVTVQVTIFEPNPDKPAKA